ncbi:Retrovirus-related Pol polyprotein from transposon TNT 1-94, partial [Trametes pubescens]
MSDDSSSSYRIEPLNGDNYHTWRIQMQDILAELELWEYVSGNNTLPANTTQQSAWCKKDAKALRAIRLRIAKDVLVYAQDAKTSKEVWDTLAETFQESGPIGIIEARCKLFHAQCPEGGDIEEHLRKLRSYQSELHALGQIVSDTDFSMIILTSLPDSWNPFIRAIDPTDLAPPSAGQSARLTSAKLIARIHQEDRCSKREDKPETALKAVDKSNTTCHKCGRRGHWLRKCCSGRLHSNQRSGADHRQHQDSSHAGGRPQDSHPCTHNNNSRAYIVNDHDSESDGDTPAREVLGTIWITKDGTNTPDSALAATDPNVYYLDSGVTTHVARNRIQFCDYSETPGKIIKGVGGHDIPQL